MNKISVQVAVLLAMTLSPVWAADVPGMITQRSPYSAEKTLDRLEQVLQNKGVTVVLRWDHAAKAKGVDIDLAPTELLLFGKPAMGSHMFTSAQTAGIDLPMKALAWTDSAGQTWLGYNDPDWLAKRHGIDDRNKVVKKMRRALAKMSGAAVAAE